MNARAVVLLTLGLALVATGVAVLRIVASFVPGVDASEDGPREESVRSVGPFDRVTLNGAFKVTIVSGASQGRVVISAARDVLARVSTEVDDGQLTVATKGHGNVDLKGVRVQIDATALHDVENQGAASIDITNLREASFALTNSGAASIRASGSANKLTLENAGVGSVDASDLIAHDADVTNAGVGSIKVHADGDLSVTVSGIGSIKYGGSPKHVEQHVNGLGSISAM